jgi:pimeloyl-ACP methyl ester carboxylesterase
MGMQSAWPLPEGVKSIEVNGYPMAYHESGSGIPLILVHGSLNDYRYWDSQIGVFAEQYRVIAVSLRHYFPEPWDGRDDDFSILQHADDLAEFTKKLNLGSVHLLGHSRGGAVVLNVAARHPEVTRTLVLVDTSGLEALLPDTPESSALSAETQQLVDRLAADVAKGDREAALRAYVEAVAGPGRWELMRHDYKQILFDNAATAIRPEERASLSCEAIRKFQFPVLPLTGEQSPKRYGEMARAIRRCASENVREPIIIPNASHAMNRNNPQVFNAAVLGFLSGR